MKFKMIVNVMKFKMIVNVRHSMASGFITNEVTHMTEVTSPVPYFLIK